MEEVQALGGINFVPAPSFLTYPSSADYRFWKWDGSCSPGLRKKKGFPGWVLFGGEGLHEFCSAHFNLKKADKVMVSGCRRPQ